MGLCGLRALRGLWGFCVRERLGGLKACGVFCLSFSLFVPVFLSFSLCLSSGALPLLFSACPLACLVCPCVLVGLCVFFFPFGIYAKNRGRSVLVRPLLSCCGFVMQNKAFRSRKIRNR